jgi:glycosyltransferase involved in cell wall biosynthesis
VPNPAPDSGAERPLRVWHACDWFVKYTAGLVRGLADVGCEVDLLTRDHDQEFGDEPGAMRAFVAASSQGTYRHLELGGRVRSLSGLRDIGRLARLRREWRPDVVHIQDSVANDARLALASGIPGHRYAITVHDPVTHPGDPISPAPIRVVRRRLRRGAALVIAHSQALAEELEGSGDVRAPIEVIPHGAGESEFVPPPPDSLLFFGRMSYYKGLDVLLDAMPAVWAKRPQTRLTVAGEGEIPPHPALADPRVTLRQEYLAEDDLPQLFTAATCLVLPYRQASQSGVGSLAMQHGRAVVATRVGGLPELVGEDWGRLVEPEDAGALAAAILEVAGTEGLAERMGRRAAETVAAEIGWKAVAARTVDCYRRHLL